jgi:hypothetical protein
MKGIAMQPYPSAETFTLFLSSDRGRAGVGNARVFGFRHCPDES